MIEHNGQTCAVRPERVLRHSVSQLGSDVLTLMELQAELLQVDLKEWTSGMVKALMAMVAGVVVLLASLPVLLIGLGYVLEATTTLPLWACMLIAAGCGIVLAGICAGLGFWLMKRDQGALNRFKTELGRNVRWLKEVLSHPSRAAATREFSTEAAPV
jgi:hypothetical protein